MALVGPSGCGKSTLLDLLALVLAPDAAEGFVFAGTDVAGLWRQRRLDQLAALRSRQLGYVLQAGGLLGFLDVRGNIRLPRQLLGLGEDGSVERLAEALDVRDQLAKTCRVVAGATSACQLRPGPGACAGIVAGRRAYRSAGPGERQAGHAVAAARGTGAPGDLRARHP